MGAAVLSDIHWALSPAGDESWARSGRCSGRESDLSPWSRYRGSARPAWPCSCAWAPVTWVMFRRPVVYAW